MNTPEYRNVEISGKVHNLMVKHVRAVRSSSMIFVNQGWRHFDVRALLLDRSLALIEYEMPNGRTYFVQLAWDLLNDRPAVEIAHEGPRYDYGKSYERPTHYEIEWRLVSYKPVAVKTMPKFWRDALAHEERAAEVLNGSAA